MKSRRGRWGAYEVEVFSADVVVVGSGIAGLFAAMGLAQDFSVTVLTKAGIARSSTEEAQGGIAAALRPDDSPEEHFRDTLRAGAGLCNEEAVEVLTQKGPRLVRKLMEMGVEFDRVQGELDFVREAAHTYRRILHAGGDMTGQIIQRRLAAHARQDGLRVEEHCFVVDLLKDENNRVAGVLALSGGRLKAWLARAVILATGGLGQLYRYTSNPEVLTGDGMAVAWRAGAHLMNMEFIQFHPTVLLKPDGKCFLISESARGEGARLINERGVFFMDDVPGKEMAPRDVVARRIWTELAHGSVYLDFSTIQGKDIREGFPQIYRNCLEAGFDIEKKPLPVMPAVHYSMGGVRADIAGRTHLENLFVCGECACNGVHGANRLASNSLLDGLVFGSEVAWAVEGHMTEGGDRGSVETLRVGDGSGDGLVIGREAEAGRESGTAGKSVMAEYAEMSAQEGHRWATAEVRRELTGLMWEKAGIIRSEAGLSEALARLEEYSAGYRPALREEDLEVSNMLALGKAIVVSALSRQESRGAHYREDYPVSSPELRRNSVCKRGEGGCGYVEFVGL